MSLIITDAGIQASIQAGEMGVSYKITHISIGSEGYTPTQDQTTLQNEILRKPITRGAIIGLGQLHFETVWDGDEEFDGKELGYWLEDGTLFAVDSRDGAVITFKRKDTVVTEACELNLAASSIDNITIELLGTPYATEEIAGIAKIASNDDVEQGTNDRSFLTIKKLVHALDISHIIDKLVTNLWLKMAAKIFPVGAAIPWFTDTAPEGFAIMKNQAFDISLYTELSKVWPDGVIPDMRGCGVIGKEDNETIGVFEEGQVKEHGHPGSSSSSTNLGSKNTNTTGNHTHAQIANGRDTNVNTSNANYIAGSKYIQTARAAIATGAAGNHYHSVSIGSHAHTLAIALFGAAKNTINHRKVNWIVRMA
ncbi:phage tail protein [Vibrio sp. DW001]|uniref:phage tail-collar fiber domain-containing protein n=1 Tax=Vibrio sp. DW001 TaxID=2912315 RepID=UPI0023AEB6A9|nr:phage tail protein [Vibrio sp. DW001]WED29882.1 phage tail protein [Vibrio sp. DW001]